jgi:hypothetical protein
VSAEETKLVKKIARKAVEDSGTDGVDIMAIVDEVLDDHPAVQEELARQSLATWLEATLSAARTPDDTPAYSTAGQRIWKQTQLFTVDESERAILRRIKGFTKDWEMAARMTAEHKRKFGQQIEMPQLLWPEIADGEATA